PPASRPQQRRAPFAPDRPGRPLLRSWRPGKERERQTLHKGLSTAPWRARLVSSIGHWLSWGCSSTCLPPHFRKDEVGWMKDEKTQTHGSGPSFIVHPFLFADSELPISRRNSGCCRTPARSGSWGAPSRP